MLAVGQLVFAFMVFLVLLVAIFPRIMYDPYKHSGKKTSAGRLMWLVSCFRFLGSQAALLFMIISNSLKYMYQLDFLLIAFNLFQDVNAKNL